MNNHSSK